jgi:hypothetical protein
MPLPRWIALVCAAMVAYLLVGIVIALQHEPLGAGLAAILAGHWGQVTMLDLYGGFFVTTVWIVTTERPWWSAVLWLAVLGLLGNVATLALVAWRGWRAATVAEIFVPARRGSPR